uniref:Piwi domain-containing protein n=1 Tax=Heterorhabditis bacteriophora TaxID=37862 RepID=A0A1I7XG48_HETBA
MNNLVDYDGESDEDSPKRRSLVAEDIFALYEDWIYINDRDYYIFLNINILISVPKDGAADDQDSGDSRQRRDSDMMFDDEAVYNETHVESPASDHSDAVGFREPPPPKRREEFHSPSPALRTPSKFPHVSSHASLVSYAGDDEKEDAFEQGSNKASQDEDIPIDSEVRIPPAPEQECNPELQKIRYFVIYDLDVLQARFEEHFQKKSVGFDSNGAIQNRKDFLNPSSYNLFVISFSLDEKGTNFRNSIFNPHMFPSNCYYEKIAEEQRKLTESSGLGKKPAGNQHFTSRPSYADATLVRAALHPKVFTYVDQLVKHIQYNFILHEPVKSCLIRVILGRFLIIPKPYGISCLGEKQENGGIFENTVYNVPVDKESINMKKLVNSNVTIADCIPFLAKMFNEPGLTFCTGIKRYCSGAIVLPANPVDFENVKKSIKFAAKKTDECPYQHKGLAIVLSSPPELFGTVSGYATFQAVGKHKEYIFVEGRAKKRAKTGKFAVQGCMEYRVLDHKYGCSLIAFAVNKFARHLPRLMFTHLLCPILGDRMYSNRLINVDGIPTLIKPSQNKMLSTKLVRSLPQAMFDPVFPVLGSLIVLAVTHADVECCTVFSGDFNDEEGVCRTMCASALRSPSLRSTQKLRNIMQCKLNNPLFGMHENPSRQLIKECFERMCMKCESTVMPYLLVSDSMRLHEGKCAKISLVQNHKCCKQMIRNKHKA